jgi:hypothetical protein
MSPTLRVAVQAASDVIATTVRAMAFFMVVEVLYLHPTVLIESDPLIFPPKASPVREAEVAPQTMPVS